LGLEFPPFCFLSCLVLIITCYLCTPLKFCELCNISGDPDVIAGSVEDLHRP